MIGAGEHFFVSHNEHKNEAGFYEGNDRSNQDYHSNNIAVHDHSGIDLKEFGYNKKVGKYIFNRKLGNIFIEKVKELF